MNIKFHLNEIKEKGFIAIVQKVLLLFVHIYAAIMALPLALIVFSLRPFVIVRFGKLRSERIGHYAYEPEKYVCDKENGLFGNKCFDVFYNGESICNEQLAKMWQRVLFVIDFPGLDKIVKYLFLFFKMASIPFDEHKIDFEKIITIRVNSKIGCHILSSRPHLYFSKKEEKEGAGKLASLGIPEGAQFVCVYGRDSDYLKEKYPGVDWSYHDVRNSDIQNYIPAIEELISRGYYVIRMGSVVKEAIKLNHRKLIDYASCGENSDFLDIYLSAKCKFWMGASGGLNSVPVVFRRPTGFVDWFELKNIYLIDQWGIILLKKIWLIEEERFLSFREILELNKKYADKSILHITQGLLKENKIKVISNSSDEIRALAIELDETVRGEYENTDDNIDLQNRFRGLFELDDKIEQYTKICSEFLCNNRKLLI